MFSETRNWSGLVKVVGTKGLGVAFKVQVQVLIEDSGFKALNVGLSSSIF